MLTIHIISFSYPKGIPEDTAGNGGGFVFDCRFLRNPGQFEKHKEVTGQDKEVMDFFKGDTEMEAFLHDVFRIIDRAINNYMVREYTHLQVAFGCTGGQHRSVYCAEQLLKHLKKRNDSIPVIQHREME